MDDIQVKVFIPEKSKAVTPKRDRKLEHQQRKLKQEQKKQKYFDKIHSNRQTEQQPQHQIENNEVQQINQTNDHKQSQRKPRVPMKQLVIHQKPQSVTLPSINVEQEGEVFTEQYFEDLQIHPNVKLGLKSSEYIKMTKIQQLAIPIVDTKANTFIKSETGSGKTLAYMVPLISHLMSAEVRITREQGTYILIVCPTRELSLQCVDAALKVGKKCPNIVVGALVGGENANHEKARLRKGVTIVVGTPGRILYHIQNTQSFKYLNIHTLVFEECDRILDMGFQKDIEQLIELFSDKIDIPSCQKIMVSAHVNQNICQIKGLEITPKNYKFVGFSKEFIKGTKNKDIQINDENQQCDWLGEGDPTWQIPSTLKQYYTLIQEHQKLAFLFAYIRTQIGKKTIIFVSTCDEVEFYSFLFQQVQFNNPFKKDQQQHKQAFITQEVYKLHGNIEQQQRSKTYFNFKKSKYQEGCVLISTSVASRGLDFPDVTNILVFDPPDSYDDYVNKVGRTARINKNGISLMVLFENLESQQFIEETQSHLAAPLNLIESAEYFKAFQYYLFETKKIHDKMPDKFLALMIKQKIKQDKDYQLQSRRAYVSFLRAYGRLKSFKIKTLNLHNLSKSFALEKAFSEDTKDERYQKDLKFINREKFRQREDQANETRWDRERKKRRVMSQAELSKMEFM
ncbi:unnamed protein product (macronuclear) [Paramecium tetraurelia]|uniref:ATP-dependent RNA helicase n=1 Tax=Paramecium tetraurelia TaxID=5888 RepID=A0DXN3_PARTE|nr:uncharacterized protein GSPATT00021424001 [Paramecium tetraurelia]CAK87800.1 unnamed protein product [Paramecium tetraurelia]|eukprot:XP_001455197.1 hypothetical protein (macronuclear) [Paramecium tetraurelia strain d4-2]